MKYILKREMLVCYEKVLIEEEKSQATIEKYMRDVRKFFQYVEEMGKKEGITKEIVLSYKKKSDRRVCTFQCKFYVSVTQSFF
ncbi:MAG: hypothetical protein ACLTEE_00135 [Anaerobutyricum hallii]